MRQESERREGEGGRGSGGEGNWLTVRAIDRWADGRASRATSGLSVPPRGGQVTSWLAARIAGHSAGHRHREGGKERERERERG